MLWYMRELVYVSEAKLQQLVPELPAGAGRLRDVEAELKLPLGSFKVGKSAQESMPGLATAVSTLEASSRAPVWFAAPQVRPGMWVHFEAPLSYSTISRGVAFLDVDKPSREYPSGGALRLFLHGSSFHLIGPRGVVVDPSELRISRSAWYQFFRGLEEASRLGDESEHLADAGDPAESTSRYVRGVERQVQRLTQLLQPELTAAWMAGYARVTAVVPTPSGAVLAASPLYVEHVDPPDNFNEPMD
jgi:uncharacterized protein DUF7019